MRDNAKTKQNPDSNTKPNIDLSHRLPLLDEFNSRTLSDSVDSMANRATSVLTMLSCQFIDDSNQLKDEIIFSVIESAIQEINDIKAIVAAHHYAQRDKRQD
jgi:hypothetical protein